jgi:hypothetical protein
MSHLLVLRCRRCGVESEPILKIVGPHVRADCPICHRFIKFIPKAQAPSLMVWEMEKGKRYDDGLIQEQLPFGEPKPKKKAKRRGTNRRKGGSKARVELRILNRGDRGYKAPSEYKRKISHP